MIIDIRDSVILFVGKRGCGKTLLLKSLLEQHHQDFDKIIAICPTDFNGGYKKLIGENNAINEFKDEYIKTILDKMEKKNENKVQTDKDFKRLLLILDDCIADINFNSCENLKKVVIAGRHFGVSLLFTSQYIKAMPPIVRNNADYLLIGQVNAQSFQILNDEFNTNKTKKEFRDMLQYAGEDYEFMIIKQTKGKCTYGLIKADY